MLAIAQALMGEPELGIIIKESTLEGLLEDDEIRKAYLGRGYMPFAQRRMLKKEGYGIRLVDCGFPALIYHFGLICLLFISQSMMAPGAGSSGDCTIFFFG